MNSNTNTNTNTNINMNTNINQKHLCEFCNNSYIILSNASHCEKCLLDAFYSK